MEWFHIEGALERAVKNSFCKKKLSLSFACLFLSGLFFSIGSIVRGEGSSWAGFSSFFFAFFLSFSLFFPFGVFLAKEKTSFRLTALSSMDLLLKTSSLFLLPTLFFSCIWICLALFFLFGQIPGIGPVLSSLFSFAPFLLVVLTFLVALGSVFFLFIAAPRAARVPLSGKLFFIPLLQRIKKAPARAFVLFILGIFPLGVAALLLGWIASTTHGFFGFEKSSLLTVIETLFVMIPFAALLSPFLLFFFHFAIESDSLLEAP